MGYDYQITVAGTAITTYVNQARFLKYTSGQRRGKNIVIPYAHGEYFVEDKFYDSADVLLEVFLPSGTTAAGANALSDLAKEFTVQDLVQVRQQDPDRGAIQANVELVTDPIPTSDDFVYLYGLNLPSGFWEDQSESTAVGNPPSVTTLGDRPVGDATLTFSNVGFLEHTDPIGQVSRVTIDAGAGAGTYIVDLGLKTVTKSAADQDAFLTITQPWWMILEADTAISFTSSVSVTVDWRNKWS